MPWTTLTFAFGSLLTSTKMTQLQDNITAVMQKLSGAPVLADNYVTTVMVGDAQITTAKQNNASGSYHLFIANSSYGDVYINTNAWNVHEPRLQAVGAQINSVTLTSECTLISSGMANTQFKLTYYTGGPCSLSAIWDYHV